MQRKKRGSSRYFVFLIVILTVLILGFMGLKKIFMKLEFFNIEKIEITGNRILEQEFLLNISLDLIGQNILSVSKRDIINKYANIARIKKIRISKRYPGKLKIIITERNAVLLAKTEGGELFPVDGEGVYLDNESFDDREILPIVNTDIPAEKVMFGKQTESEFLIRVIDFYYQVKNCDPDFFSRISQIFEKDEMIYLVELQKGYLILLGEDELSEKIKRYNFVEKNRKFEKDSVIDLRFKDKLIVRTEGE